MLVKPYSSLALVPLLALVASPANAAVDTPRGVSEAYGKVPLQFEESRGQSDATVRFLSHGPGYSLRLTSNEAMLVLAKPSERAAHTLSAAVALRMSVIGARRAAAVSGEDELPGKASHFIGNDPSKWRTNVPTYAKVRVSGVYPGIDLVYYGQQRQLEYDFVVAPGVDPGKIALGFEGADAVEIDAQGELVLHTAAGDVRQHKPIVYQEIDGRRREIDGGYVRKSPTRVGFEVAEYDRSRPLVIDPVLVYSTYLGGSSFDIFTAIAIDGDGNAYVTGVTASADFPVTAGTIQKPAPPPNYQTVFVSKLDSTGTTLLYSATFGGTWGQLISSRGIVVDSDHNVYVAGSTTSPTFPTTEGAFQRSWGGVRCCVGDAFVTKLNATGSALLYSTFLGGGGDESADAIAVDADGNAYVTGFTNSGDFPRTANGCQPGRGTGDSFVTDAFVAKLNPSGSALVYSTYLGGEGDDHGYAIAVDADGNAFVTGATNSADFPTTAAAFQKSRRGWSDAFVRKLDSTGSALLYSTYLGGSVGPGESGDYRSSGSGIAVDAWGYAYVTGATSTGDFPVTPGAFQAQPKSAAPNNTAFVTKLDPAGSGLVYSTYLGGSGYGDASGIAVDIHGNAFVTGSTSSTDFPLTSDAFAPTLRGDQDAFVTVLDPSGSALIYSTFLGGSGIDSGRSIAVDTGGNAYVAGETSPLSDGQNDFPTTPHAFRPGSSGDLDGFVVKIAGPATAPRQPGPSPANTGSTPAMPSAAASIAESGATAGSGGGGAIDWLSLPALLAALGLARRGRAPR